MSVTDAANALNEARDLVRAAKEIAFMMITIGENDASAVDIEAVGCGLECILERADLRLDEARAALNVDLAKIEAAAEAKDAAGRAEAARVAEEIKHNAGKALPKRKGGEGDDTITVDDFLRQHAPPRKAKRRGPRKPRVQP